MTCRISLNLETYKDVKVLLRGSLKYKLILKSNFDDARIQSLKLTNNVDN